jgi:hypothetical protein
MAEHREATLAEVEELGRQAGADHVTLHRPIVDHHRGRLPEEVCSDMERSNAAFFERCLSGIRAAGAKRREAEVYARGLHAGMKQGNAAIFLPYLTPKGSG